MHFSARMHSTAPENLDLLRDELRDYGLTFAPDTLRDLCRHLHESYYAADTLTDCGGVCVPSATFHGSYTTANSIIITSRGCDTVEIVCFLPTLA